MYGSKLVVVAL